MPGNRSVDDRARSLVSPGAHRSGWIADSRHPGLKGAPISRWVRHDDVESLSARRRALDWIQADAWQMIGQLESPGVPPIRVVLQTAEASHVEPARDFGSELRRTGRGVTHDPVEGLAPSPTCRRDLINHSNAEILRRVGYRFSFRILSYNQTLLSGQSISFGFQAGPHCSGRTLSNVVFNGVRI